MQKIFFLIFILSVVVSFSACGETLPKNSGTQNSDFVTSSSDTETEGTSDSISNTSSETEQTSASTDLSTDQTSDTNTSVENLPSDSETDHTTDSQNTETETEEVSDSKNTDTVTSTSTTNRPSDTESEKVTDSKDTDTTTDTSTNRPSDTKTEKDTDSKETDTATNTSTTTDAPSSSTTTTDTTTDSSESVDADTPTEDPPKKPANTDISPIDPENYFGVQWLSSQTNGSNLVKAYQDLVAGIKEMKEEIPLSAEITENEFSTVWYCFESDYPQYFWLGSQFEYYTRGNKVTKILPDYTLTKNQLPEAQKSFDKAVKKLLAGINRSMTQYEIEKTIHDRLVVLCKYQETKNAHNAYGALVNGTAVCEGITKAFQHLCRSVGIETLFVFGKSYNPTSGNVEGHSWNIVKIDKNYYHIDVTWDNAGEPTEDEMHYAWFNLPTNWINEDHVLAQMGYAYPNCTETKDNFFTKNNGRLSKLSVDEIVKRTIKHGNEYFFRAYLTDQIDPYQWMKDNGGDVAEKLGLNGYQYKIITTGHEVTIVMSDYKG